MGLRVIFNVFTGTFDYIDTGASGSGNVTGPGSSTDKAITRWNGTTGTLIADSKTKLQDGGAIEAQGFITRRQITELVTIPNSMSWISPSIELQLSGSIDLALDGEIIIV